MVGHIDCGHAKRGHSERFQTDLGRFETLQDLFVLAFDIDVFRFICSIDALRSSRDQISDTFIVLDMALVKALLTLMLSMATDELRNIDITDCHRVEINHCLLVFSVFRRLSSWLNFLWLEVFITEMLCVPSDWIDCDLETASGLKDSLVLWWSSLGLIQSWDLLATSRLSGCRF